MAEYINRELLMEAVQAMLDLCKKLDFETSRNAYEAMLMMVKTVPAADVMKVVRCEDCVSSGGNRFGELICQNQLCPCYGREVDHAFSCIYGERRAE